MELCHAVVGLKWIWTKYYTLCGFHKTEYISEPAVTEHII